MKNNSNNTRLILLHPYVQKQGSSSNKLWLLGFVSLFPLAFLVTFIYMRETAPAKVSGGVVGSSTSSTTFSSSLSTTAYGNAPLPTTVINTLLHYASKSSDMFHMSHSELKPISDVLRKCSSPCNFLVFGLTHETLLWRALNHNGRTIFVDENRYYAAYIEQKHPEIEAYDVHYSTKMSEMHELMASAKNQIRDECKPVQNLLFSECKLGINDLPNNVYEIDWDVILVDGPREDQPEAPGRMSSIFTAGVLARSKKGGNPKTHIFLHDFWGEVERTYGEEFLCRENLVKADDKLAHFVLERKDAKTFNFCGNNTSSSDRSSK